MIEIRATHEPYRRCGRSHSKAPQLHAYDAFSADEWKLLVNDPHLVVTHVENALLEGVDGDAKSGEAAGGGKGRKAK